MAKREAWNPVTLVVVATGLCAIFVVFYAVVTSSARQKNSERVPLLLEVELAGQEAWGQLPLPKLFSSPIVTSDSAHILLPSDA
eukprot:5253461-Amphidinium_carterae.1